MNTSASRLDKFRHIKIITRDNGLAMAVGRRLEPSGMPIEVLLERQGYQLCVPLGTPLSTIQQLKDEIAPLNPPVVLDPQLPQDQQAVLCLDHDFITPITVRVRCLNAEQAAEAVHHLNLTGGGMIRAELAKPRFVKLSQMTLGATVEPSVRDKILFELHGLLGHCPKAVTPRAMLDENVIDLTLAPRQMGDDPAKFIDLELLCDDAELASSLMASGLGEFKVRASAKAPKPRFTLELGALGLFPASSLELQQQVQALLAAQGVDPSCYPLQIKRPKKDGNPVSAVARLHLPITALRSKKLTAWAGDKPDRVHLIVKSDDATAGSVFATQLRVIDYSVLEKPLPVEEIALGFAVLWGKDAQELPEQRTAILEAVKIFLRFELGEGFETEKYRFIHHHTSDTLLKHQVQINLPVAAAKAGQLSASVLNYRVKLICAKPESWTTLQTELRSWGFQSVSVDTRHADGAQPATRGTVRYGGAPADLIAEITKAVHRADSKIAVSATKAWLDADPDIFLHLPLGPDQSLPSSAPASQEALALQPLLKPPSEEVRPFLAIEGEELVIGGRLRLVIRQDTVGDPLIPVLDPGFCLDQPTATALYELGLNLWLRQPMLLEGPTGASKTSAIRHLAALLRQPLFELYFSSSTEKYELAGRFVPNSDATHPPYVWSNGMVPQAMERGGWLVLEEPNQALDSAFLERLNSVVSPNPRLVLSERDGRVIAPHDAFRILAASNPAEYEGRSVMSPAWRNRWIGYRFCSEPSSADIEAMLVYQVTGQQPLVHIPAVGWVRGNAAQPLYPALAHLAEGDLFKALAKYHVAVQGLVTGEDDANQLVSQRRERPVITRRNCLAALQFIHSNLQKGLGLSACVNEALAYYYIGLFADEADRSTLRSLQEACGIGCSHE